MRSRFPCGNLRLAPGLFEIVPRTVFIEAFKAHFTGQAVERDGQLRSDHAHGGVSFYLATCLVEGVTRAGVE